MQMVIEFGKYRVVLGTPEACQKVRYGHLETAERAVREMAAKGSVGLEPYECEACRGWHIGHGLDYDLEY